MNRMSPRLPGAIHVNEMRALNGTYEPVYCLFDAYRVLSLREKEHRALLMNAHKFRRYACRFFDKYLGYCVL